MTEHLLDNIELRAPLHMLGGECVPERMHRCLGNPRLGEVLGHHILDRAGTDSLAELGDEEVGDRRPLAGSPSTP